MVKTFPHSECWNHRHGSPSLINRIYIYIKLNRDYGCFLFAFSYFQFLTALYISTGQEEQINDSPVSKYADNHNKIQ